MFGSLGMAFALAEYTPVEEELMAAILKLYEVPFVNHVTVVDVDDEFVFVFATDQDTPPFAEYSIL